MNLPRWRPMRLLAAVLAGWFVTVNAWGPFVLTTEANRHIESPSLRLRIGTWLMVLAALVTVMLGAHLARRRQWALSFLLAPLGAGCSLVWLMSSAVFYGNGIRSVAAVVFWAIPVVLVVFALFALGWPLGRIWRAAAGQ